MKIYAHRGFSAKFPEATRAAYEGALSVKADGLECDVRLTRDQVPICFHDRNLKRIAGISKSVAELSLDEIRKITDVLTLSELVELVTKNKVELLIETKHPTRFGRAVEKAVLREISGSTEKRITVMSFSLLAVLWLRKSTKSVGYVVAHRWRLIFVPTRIVAIDVELFNRSRWVRNRLQDKEVLLWTVNELDQLKFPKQVAGVITDRPDLPFRLS
jgi:glycerophosphoryl diester phosphodiesterase